MQKLGIEKDWSYSNRIMWTIYPKFSHFNRKPISIKLMRGPFIEINVLIESTGKILKKNFYMYFIILQMSKKKIL